MSFKYLGFTIILLSKKVVFCLIKKNDNAKFFFEPTFFFLDIHLHTIQENKRNSV